MSQRVTNRWKRLFRILDKWNIKHFRSSVYAAQCTRNKETKEAALYGWPRNNPPIPIDFFYHEILHVALLEYRAARGWRRIRAAEEDLIQDLCMIFREAICKGNEFLVEMGQVAPTSGKQSTRSARSGVARKSRVRPVAQSTSSAAGAKNSKRSSGSSKRKSRS